MKEQKDNNSLVAISDLAAQFKADVDNRFERFREEIQTDNMMNRSTIREETEVDMKEAVTKAVTKAVTEAVTESVGSMSVTVTQLNGVVDAMKKDIQGLKDVVGYVEPQSSGVVEDVEASVTHVQQQLGPINAEELSQTLLDALTTISPRVTANSGADRSEPDVPTTPTPDTPSDQASVFLREQAHLFVGVVHRVARLYKLSTSFRRG